MIIAAARSASLWWGVLPVTVAGLLLQLFPLLNPLPTFVHGNQVIDSALRLLEHSVTNVRVISPEQVRVLYLQAGARPPVGLQAFRMLGNPRIYVSAESVVYSEARRSLTTFNLLRIAATLLHEQVHETDGEFAASRLQADFVRAHLHRLPRSERRIGGLYWRRLEGRALSLALAERRLRR